MPRPSSVWHPDSVQEIAQSLGLSTLSDEVAQALAGDVEFRLHEVIEEALKFASHAKRTSLTAQDVDYALKVKNIEPIFGFLSSAPGVADYQRLKLPGSAGTVYYLPDEEIDLQKVLSTPLPPIPREESYSAHWLAIEGVQPAIPQNPLPSETAARTNTNANKASKQKARDEIDVRPLIKHVLSRELQLYYDRVTAAAMDNDQALRAAALSSFRSDTGLSGLVPYLVQWAGEKVVSSLSILQYVGSSAEAGFNMECVLAILFSMLQNKTMFVEPYLHQIMPTVLTCLLNDSIPSTLLQTRRQAASLLAYILNNYATSYPSLKPRVLKTMLRALVEPERSVASRIGAIMGIIESGNQAITSILAQETNLKALGGLLDRQESDEARDCARLVVSALASGGDAVDDMDADDATDEDDLGLTYGTVLGVELSKNARAVRKIQSQSG